METLAQILFPQAAIAWTPADLVQFGKSRGWHFQIMEEKGVLTGKVTKPHAILKSQWVFEPDLNTNITPEKEKAYGILEEVRKAGFPIEQVIYGYQVKPEKKPLELPKLPKASPETTKFIGDVVVGGLTLAAGATALVLYGIVKALASDPALIVILHGEDTWVCLYSWDD